MPEPCIVFDNVTKTYHIQKRATPRIGAWLLNKAFEHLRRVPFNALEDFSLTIDPGHMVGLLGTNGAGKSTVMKLTAGITQPTRGTVRTRGRISSMLELGVGFHPELSGMENIFYSGIVMGMTRAEVLERLERIIDFAGLRDFIYEPVKHYSSGMYARLAFSVALHVDPDIVLADEILAVGDGAFQERGFARLMEMYESGATVVLVTHHLMAAEETCDRLIWIEEGRIRSDGEPRIVASEYRRHVGRLGIRPDHNLAPEHTPLRENAEEPPAGCAFTRDNAPRIVGARIEDAAGNALEAAETDKPCRFVLTVDDGRAPAPYRLWIAGRWLDGRRLFEDESGLLQPSGEGGRDLVYECSPWPFLRDDFSLSAALMAEDGTLLDRRIDLLRFRTKTDESYVLSQCVICPPASWTVESPIS